MMNSHIKEVLKEPLKDFKEEALFYLSACEFDYRKAADSYDEDYRFELEHAKKSGIKK